MLINPDNSHTTGIPFSSTVNPATVNPRVLPEPANNVDAAAGIIRGSMKGGSKGLKLKRRANKISRKYKMRHSRKASRRTKRRLRAKYSRHRRGGSRRYIARGMAKGRALGLQGGKGGQHPLLHMRGGWAQYNLNKPADIGYSSGNVALSAKDSALANPVPVTRYDNAIDNLNHNAPNAYGNTGAGSGFASKGWF